jgi:hypothetical protein
MTGSAGQLGQGANQLGATIADIMRLLRHAAYEIASCSISMEMMSRFLSGLSDTDLADMLADARRHFQDITRLAETITFPPTNEADTACLLSILATAP